MKNCKLFLLMVVLFTSLVFSATVNAAAEKSAFDYSAEKMECRIAPHVIDTEESERNRDLLGEVSDLDWSIGPEDAVLTIIEYADFQCPYCADASLSLIEYQKEHSDDVRLVYRHFPLSFHEKAVPAALAANAAGYQGMFFEAEEFLFKTQSEWSVLENNEVFTEWLIQEFSKFADLDFDLWYLAFSDSDNEAAVRNMYTQVIKAGIVSGTPTVFLNYVDSNYMFDAASLDSLIENIRIEENKFSDCPDVVIEEEKTYTAVLETEFGDIHVALFSDTDPNALNSFIFLVNSGWFDGSDISEGYDGFTSIIGNGTNPGFFFTSRSDFGQQFHGSGYVGFACAQSICNSGSFFITNNIEEYYLKKIRKDTADLDFSKETILQYVQNKVLRFSKQNAIFGQIAESDLEKIGLMYGTFGVKRVRITQ